MCTFTTLTATYLGNDVYFNSSSVKESLGTYCCESWHVAPKMDDAGMFELRLSDGLLKRKYDGEMLIS